MTKIFLTIVLMFLSFPALAQDHAGHDGHKGMKDVYAPAMEKMHENMMIKPTGDADVDFVRGMIPHHQGAVDMAKILLKEGKDPELKKLAKEIVASQEKEIAFMKAWLEKEAKTHADH